MTLTEFLLARIGEDEALLATVEDPAPMPESPEIPPWLTGQIIMHPARVRADCEAKRRIVQERLRMDNPDTLTDRLVFPTLRAAFDFALMTLGTVYADHPDYDEAWRPAE